MTRETWMHDLRMVDDVVMRSGEALRIVDADVAHEKTATLRMIYWLAVAIWHLLDDKIKEGSHAGKKTD